MNKRFIVCALGISAPGSMGGNTKIALELIRNLSQTIPVIVITTTDKIPTLTQNIALTDSITVHSIPPFGKNPFLHSIGEALYYKREIEPILTKIAATKNDIVYSCSDFLPDVLPLYMLKPRFKFIWVPTLFLFVPFIFENIIRHYKFPALKYLVYFFYQRLIFQLIKARGDLFVITNECDKVYFPNKLQARVFPFYGGVNIEQIQAAQMSRKPDTLPTHDVVYCSRLHPQKGIDSFLDVWKRVISSLPFVRLTVIGNGTPHYETYLRKKAERLGIGHTIDWLGYVNNEQKYHIYLSSRLFVHPTIYDNNGMVAAEALCSGLPVVMYDLPNLRSLYTRGCFKVAEGDSSAFSSAIVHLLDDPTAYAAIKPNPEACLSLQDQWAWQSRTNLFRGFLKNHLALGCIEESRQA